MKRVLVASSAALYLVSFSSFGASVNLGTDESLITVSDQVSEARYRLSNTGWDQMLSNGGAITSQNIVTNGLGNATSLNNTTWDFTVSYESGDDGVQGFTFSMTQVGGSGSGSLVYNVANPINGETPIDPFNAINISVRAGALRDSNESYEESAYINITGLSFTSGLASTGSLDDPLSAFTPPTTAESNTNWITSDMDLSLFDWTLSGTVQGGFDCNGAGSTTCLRDESVKMNLSFANASVIPVPAAVWLFGSALGALGVARRRLTR